MSDSFTSLFFPTTESISCLALFIKSGWLISSASAHSVVIADVSVPAANISCHEYLLINCVLNMQDLLNFCS